MFGPTHCIYAHSIADIQEKDVSELRLLLTNSIARGIAEYERKDQEINLHESRYMANDNNPFILYYS